ncbi:C2 domain-containing protein [Mucor lusitanicus]
MAHPPPPPPLAGELVVVALKAAPGKQDPFCLFRVGDVIKRTKTDYGGGLYPIWDDQVNIPVAAGHYQMHVQIFDKDTKPNNLMGDGIVDLKKVLRDKEHDGYFPLNFRGRQGTGVIYLELTFYSAQNSARPQQQVRYQYPPGHVPGGNFRPPQQQHRPPHSTPPPQQQQHHHPRRIHNSNRITTRPLPQPPIQQQHRPPPMSQPQPYPQPRPSSSMGTAQMFSPVMPSPQPLLSAPYQPAPSPATRPAHVNYPNQQRQSFPTPAPYHGGPPGGFHDPSQQHHYPSQPPPPQGGGYYPPQPQHHANRPPPPPPSNMGYPRPNNTMGYPYQ